MGAAHRDPGLEYERKQRVFGTPLEAVRFAGSLPWNRVGGILREHVFVRCPAQTPEGYVCEWDEPVGFLRRK